MRDFSRRIAIGVSACLMGENVRYDGGNKLHPFVVGELARQFELVPICPEVMAGLGTPRPPVQLVEVVGSVRAQGMELKSLDVTDALLEFSGHYMCEAQGLAGLVLKSRSPSCGHNTTPIYNQSGECIGVGSGVFAGYLEKECPKLPIIDEQQLNDRAIRKAFLAEVELYAQRQATQSSLKK